jgi:hypothetical protein
MPNPAYGSGVAVVVGGGGCVAVGKLITGGDSVAVGGAVFMGGKSVAVTAGTGRLGVRDGTALVSGARLQAVSRLASTSMLRYSLRHRISFTSKIHL